MSRITSAYNFAPLARQVVCPAWQDAVSHDLPFADGLCAELHVEIECHTPTLVGAERKAGDKQGNVGIVNFFSHPDGKPAIPGSALRGMLRNVLEVATFSRMQLMDDKALSLRDFTERARSSRDSAPPSIPYLGQLVGGDVGDPLSGAKPLARGGWLWFDGDAWRLESAAVARIDHELIRSHFKLGPADWPAHESPEKRHWRVAAAKKYKAIYDACARDTALAKPDGGGLVRVRFRIKDVEMAGGRFEEKLVHQHSGGKWLAYRKASQLLRVGEPVEGSKPGVLVVTGQGIPTKHMEFIFGICQRKADAMEVPPATMTSFLEVHGHEDSEWRSLWAARAAAGSPVPVFFLEGNDGLRIGLTQMFRLPGKRTLGAIARAQQVPIEPSMPLDFVQTLFGHVDEAQGGLKGRISVGDCRWHGAAGSGPILADSQWQQETVLAQPKPGFYPNYLEQQERLGALQSATYQTILSNDAALRGWKRYPVRPLAEVKLADPPSQNAKSNSKLRPLAPGSRFSGTLRLHNVKTAELGAVVWALTWGGADNLRHALGMGKPFGFGQISIHIAHSDVRMNDPAAKPTTIADCRRQFVAYMQSQLFGWDTSEPLRELLAMADPSRVQAQRAVLKPLTLTVGGGKNAFAEAKRHDPKQGAPGVLPRYSRVLPPR